MADGTRAVVVGPNEGATLEGPVGGPLTFKVRGAQTNGALNTCMSSAAQATAKRSFSKRLSFRTSFVYRRGRPQLL